MNLTKYKIEIVGDYSVLDYRESNKEHISWLNLISYLLEILGGEPWTTVAAAMLNQRLTIPGGGLTLDR